MPNETAGMLVSHQQLLPVHHLAVVLWTLIVASVTAAAALLALASK
jgi:hypothetical protein